MSEASKCGGHSSDICNCQSVQVNPSVHQNLDELEFERSIYQAAIDNNVQKILQFSKRSGFDVNAMDNFGYSALHYSSRNGSLEATKCLIKLGANVNLPTGGLKATPLHRAVTANKMEMVEYLLSVGADTNLEDSDGATARNRAEKERLEKLIQLFDSAESPQN